MPLHAVCSTSIAGNVLAFEELEEGAAAGRDVADAIGDAVARDRRQRIATAGDGESAIGGRLGDRQRDLMRAFRKRIELEHADRAVPDDRAGIAQQCDSPTCALRPMSRIISSACTSSARLTVAGAVAENSFATTTSIGSGSVAPLAASVASTFLHSGTRSGSASDLPIRILRPAEKCWQCLRRRSAGRPSARDC